MQHILRSILVLCVSLPAGSAMAGPVAELPLERGYFVSTEVGCANASNATLNLVTRTEFNWPQYGCVLGAIDQTGPTTFSVTAACSDLNSEETAIASSAVFEIPDPRSFTLTLDGSSYGSSRFCAQADLPWPWHDNDISDFIK